MNGITIYLCVVAAAAAAAAVYSCLTCRKDEHYRNECWKIARRMRREMSSYPAEKQIACASWLARLGLRTSHAA